MQVNIFSTDTGFSWKERVHPDRGHSAQPLCLFLTDDISASLKWLRELGVEITGEPQDIGSVIIATFKDPDGNELMACQRK